MENSTFIVVITMADGMSYAFPYDNEDDAVMNAESISAVIGEDSEYDTLSVIVCQSAYNVNLIDAFITKQ